MTSPPNKLGGESFRRAAVISMAMLLLMYAAGSSRAEALVKPSYLRFLRELKNPGLSRRDAEQLQRGYYEQLTGLNRLNSRLWEVYAGAGPPEDRRPLRDTDLVFRTGDFLYIALKPGLDTLFQNEHFRTNQWSMRDGEYDLIPDSGVWRIALLGQSYVMGGGVANDQTFETLVEKRLQARTATNSGRIELLNFGMGNYMPARQLFLLQRKVLRFQPDVVISIGHQADLSRLPSNIADALYRRVEPPFPYIRDLLRRLNVDFDTPHGEVMRRLMPYRVEMYRAVQTEFAATLRDLGIIPVWIFVPTPEMTLGDVDVEIMLRLSREAGFATFDLSDVYGDDARDLWVNKWDVHPNAEGHRRIAARLYDLLTADSLLLGGTR